VSLTPELIGGRLDSVDVDIDQNETVALAKPPRTGQSKPAAATDNNR
jgi:hypothetical protein